jgi:hypothetical protein
MSKIRNFLSVSNKIFSGNQPCQYGIAVQIFRRLLCLHHEGRMLRVSSVCFYNYYIVYAPSCTVLDQWGLRTTVTSFPDDGGREDQ